MENVIIIGILVIIASAAAWYLHRTKQRGETCVGCPHAKLCAKEGGTSNCSCGSKQGH